MAARAVALIPVRLDSSRLPGKALLRETGTPLFLHTVNAARACPHFDLVAVATDSEEVLTACESNGVLGIPTSDRPRSGSERCAEALAQLPEAEIIVDVQVDWPELTPDDLSALVRELDSEDPPEVATLACPLDTAADFQDPGVVKVVRGGDGSRALYFSRAAIPSSKERPEDPDAWRLALRHIGVYAFSRRSLEALAQLPDSALEAQEELEQLRWLAAGYRLSVLDASGRPRGIETRADYDSFLARCAGGEK